MPMCTKGTMSKPVHEVKVKRFDPPAG
jgi:hypothetical protein